MRSAATWAPRPRRTRTRCSRHGAPTPSPSTPGWATTPSRRSWRTGTRKCSSSAGHPTRERRSSSTCAATARLSTGMSRAPASAGIITTTSPSWSGRRRPRSCGTCDRSRVTGCCSSPVSGLKVPTSPPHSRRRLDPMDAVPSFRSRVASCLRRPALTTRMLRARRRASIATRSTRFGRSPRRPEAKPMPGFVAGALVAHPPILLTEVGGEQSQRVRATADAMRQLDGILSTVDAPLAVVVSPHSPASMTSLPVRRAAHAAGDLARFRAPEVRVEAQVDVALAAALVVDGQRAGFSLIWAEESELDHGVVVPLHSLPRTMAGKRCIFLGVSGWPLSRFVEFGDWLQRRLQDRSAILIASGDLSHRLTPDAPYGFRPQGPVFDRLVIDALRARAWEQIEALDPDLVEEAGECGLRPLAILLGAGRAANMNSRVLSYEGPFGVGYPVVAFTASAAPTKVLLDVQTLGRQAIDTYLRTRRLIEPPEPIPVELQAPSAVFVTLRKDGELRGCVGSLRPTEATAAHELIRYAVASAVRDPRFDPVRLDEVSALGIKVQLLDPPEPVTDIGGLDPHTYWIIVRRGDRQALLLPGIDGIETPEQQVLAAFPKAGIDRYAPLQLERFRARTLA